MAPTSVLGDASSLRGTGAPPPPTDTAPFAGTAQLHGEAPYGHPSSGWQDLPPRRRRAGPWVVAVLAACVLFAAGMVAIDQFGSGDDGGALGLDPSPGATAEPTHTGSGQKRTPTAGPPSAGGTTGRQPDRSAGAAAPGTPENAGAPEVVYKVTASGSRNTGSVTYTDRDGEFIRLHGISLPWRRTFPVSGQRKPLILNAQRKGGGDAGPVTCTITVDGKLLASTTADGKYASAQCVASG